MGRTTGKKIMARDPITHIVVMDGTLSTLRNGLETNAGLTYRLLSEIGQSSKISLNYIEGLQWPTWRGMINVVAGVGINNQIRRAYGYIASRYRPGDRIFLFGFSRGAYAARSLAGIIDQIGMLKSGHATERHIRQVLRLYKQAEGGPFSESFAAQYCHPAAPIEMIGVWDTVKSLGIEYPLLWRLAPENTDFHSHGLGPSIRNGFHALARDETRSAFAPVMWETTGDWAGHVEQAWFRGAHSDVGGDVRQFLQARALSNISLVWMLENAEKCGLTLPDAWRDRFPTDPFAPAYGRFRGLAKFYLFRKRRAMLIDPSEYLHPSAASAPETGQNRLPKMRPRLRHRGTV
jgi:uncharacterized protein (DUF2235 family)